MCMHKPAGLEHGSCLSVATCWPHDCKPVASLLVWSESASGASLVVWSEFASLEQVCWSVASLLVLNESAGL